MNVGILGLGLIGGSLARAYAKNGHSVYAADMDETMLEFAQLAGVVSGELNVATIPDCDLILLAVYAGASAQWLSDHASHIRSDSLVMDCCGIKEMRRYHFRSGFAYAGYSVYDRRGTEKSRG